MAEAVAGISLIASIIQLIDFGSKLVERLNDFLTSTEQVPEAFRNISIQLPLAFSTIENLSGQIDRNEFSGRESNALKVIVERSTCLIEEVNGIVDEIVPLKTSSSFEKRLMALRSLRHDKRIQNASAQLLQNVEYLTFFQATRIQVSIGDLSQRLSGANLSTISHASSFEYGLNLGGAPRLAEGTFVGRDSELNHLAELLKPESPRQSVVVIVGMSGIGKTQLGIEFALSHQNQYSSIFWLNAQDESSLRADLIKMSEIVFLEQKSKFKIRADESDLIQNLRKWLSHPANRKWLLIFDNFDNPKLPGDNDPTSFDIRAYLPYRSQGMILITTRSRKITFAKQLQLEKLKTAEQGLKVLSVQSGRSFQNDQDAIDLVKRLDGLPLALASAASFLERTSCTVKEYLDEYERSWLMDDKVSPFEYGDRTLFTGWNLSFEKVKSQCIGTSEILRILAFFGSENIDYDLLVAQDPTLWPGLGDRLHTKATFHRSMSNLRDHSLIETSDRSYRLHSCLHDWTLSNLNQQIDEHDVWRALNCILFAAESRSSIWSTNYDDSGSQLAPHALRLTQPRLFNILTMSELNKWRSIALCALGQMLHRAGRDHEALPLVLRSLDWSQKHLGPDHRHSISVCNVLGIIHQGLQNYVEAETLLKKAAFSFERTVGRHNKATLDPVHNLALFYMQMDRLEDAEEMYRWSLKGCEESYGLQDPNTFWAVMALADYYMATGEVSQAEKEFCRALSGFDGAISTDHFFSQFIATRLGAIYYQQGEYHLAATMYQRVYESCLRLLGPDHWMTLEAQADMNGLESRSLSVANFDSVLSSVRVIHKKLAYLQDMKVANAVPFLSKLGSCKLVDAGEEIVMEEVD